MSAAASLQSAERFSDIAVEAPHFESVRAEYDELEHAIETAAGPEQARQAFFRWDELRRDFATWASLTELRFQQDTNDPQRKADADALNELRPKLTGLDVTVKRKLLTSPLRAQLERELGAYLFDRWEMDVTAFDPAIEQDCVRESTIENNYVELLARASFNFNGERLNLSTISKYGEDPNRDLRRRAFEAKWSFYEEHAQELDSTYDDLVRLRTQMARKLDYRNFIELGYRRMMRTDYGPSHVAGYREEIAREIVPLAQRIVDAQAREIGVDRVMYWDEQIFSTSAPPRPPQAYDEMVSRARDAFRGVDSGIGSFASMMVERDLLDLQSREGKAGGGFCTSFPTHGLPYIFANFNGTTGDVNVLVHEMGHAFQSYSSRSLPVLEYLWPTYEACEVHSMSMEFFSWPQLEHFFGSDAQRYRMQHLKTSILFLPYGAAVDHFQHFVYENPDATPAERNAFWKQLEATYLPWRDYGGIKRLEDGGLWQAQRHIYLMPFYYIDYTLALCCALQFWSKSLDDYSGALRDYTQLCKRGGELPFLELVRSAGLKSPFESGVLHGVAKRAASIMQI
jgi:M3 family oligoendopeptidase